MATREHEVGALEGSAEISKRYGEEITLLDREAVRAEVISPTYLPGLWYHTGCALVDPARLAWGLRRAAAEDGVRIHEHTRVTGLRRDGHGVLLETASDGRAGGGPGAGAARGRVRAKRNLWLRGLDRIGAGFDS